LDQSIGKIEEDDQESVDEENFDINPDSYDYGSSKRRRSPGSNSKQILKQLRPDRMTPEFKLTSGGDEGVNRDSIKSLK